MRDVSAIRLLVLDVDGVLTDGLIEIDEDGRETKRFNVSDGFGLRMWRESGGAIAIISGRKSAAVVRRAEELGVTYVFQSQDDKGEGIRKLAERAGVEPDAMAYVGDDWPDVAAFRVVGYAIAVANAEPLVKEASDHVTARPGGHGGVRDAVEHLLGLQGKLDESRARYHA